tara:strand:+ start:7708 stop:8187 length:480 start_codon:yes stop_codon:yes gene_type:complete
MIITNYNRINFLSLISVIIFICNLVFFVSEKIIKYTDIDDFIENYYQLIFIATTSIISFSVIFLIRLTNIDLNKNYLKITSKKIFFQRKKTEIDILKEMIDEIYVVKRFNFFVNLFNPSIIILRIKSQRKKNNVYRIKLRFFSTSKIKEIDSLINKNYG